MLTVMLHLSRGVTMLFLIIVLVSGVASAQQPRPTRTPEQPRPGLDPQRARGRQAARQGVIVTTTLESSTSPPLSGIGPTLPEPGDTPQEQPAPHLDPERARGRARGAADRTLQTAPLPRAAVEAGQNFTGIRGGGNPPDPTGAAGETQYVQAVNSSFAVFDKRDGRLLYGPVAISTLWTGVDSPCARHNAGDPVVVYDRIAKRWIISQFLLSEQFGECVAVSATEDATGPYHRYRFAYDDFPDYPKFGVWPDGYYVSYNLFRGDNFFASQACALERDKMLAGAGDARQVCFQTGVFGLLPSDFDGRELPPAGSPNYFLRRSGDGTSLGLRRFHVDWSNPNNSTFGVGDAHDPNAVIRVEPFNDTCAEAFRGRCIPQPNGIPLESLGDRLMFRLAYRRFADREVLIANQTIEPVSNPSRGAIRWYEIRDPNGTPTVFQQGTFLPDTRSRWMGSAAMDGAGNIAVGYSLSGPDLPPGIRIATRSAGDPLGVLGGETLIVDGESQGSSRWGDYSQMSIDPTDDCTFWFTAEYISGGIRSTRIASFKVNSCSAGGGGGGGGGGGASGRIVFVSTRDGNRDIYSMDVNGGDVRHLTTNPAADYSPQVSPDGRSIVFVSERDGGNPEIYVMDINGGNQRRLTTNPAHDDQPTWAPRTDGRAGPEGRRAQEDDNRPNGRNAVVAPAAANQTAGKKQQ